MIEQMEAAATINELAAKCHALAKEKGWWDGLREGGADIAAMHGYLSTILEKRRAGVEWKVNRDDADSLMALAVALSNASPEKQHIPTLLSLIHSEVSEALTEWVDTNGRLDRSSPSVPGHNAFAVELADVIIRVLDFACALGFEDFGGTILAKVEYNKTRPTRHGGKAF